MSSQIKAYQQQISELESERFENFFKMNLNVKKFNNKRNSMTIAHQCQLSQLKDSFKERMKSNEGWPEKLAFELNKEREKHNETVKSIENELRQNFLMVLII